MSRTGTWLLAFVALVLLGWIFLAPDGWRQPPLGAGDYVLRFDADAVRSLEIVRDGEILRFQRVADGWEMGPRPADRAQAAAVERILESAQLLRILDRIRADEITPEQEQTLGFVTPKQTLRVETPEGTEVLLFGREGAGEGRHFVRRGDSSHTYLVGDELQKLLLLPTDTLRDPRLVALPAALVERVRLTRPEGILEWQKEAAGWRITRPLQARADGASFENALEHILGARIFAFHSGELPAEAVEPLGILEIWPEGEDLPIRLQVMRPEEGNTKAHLSADEGGKASGETSAPYLLVWHEGRQATVKVAAENFSLLEKTPDHWRSRNLAQIDPDIVDRITVRMGGEEMEFRRTAQDSWESALGDRAVPTEWMTRLWQLLNEAQVEEFILAGADRNSVNGNGSGSLGGLSQQPSAEIFFDSWLTENTPEAVAGRHPILEVKIWSQDAPSSVLAKVNDEVGRRRLSTDFWNQFMMWWQDRPGEE